MGNICNAASKSYHIAKSIVGLIAIAIAIFSFINGDLIQAIFLAVVFVFTFGDVVINWSKYKLLDRQYSELHQNNQILENENDKFFTSNKKLENENDKLEIHVESIEKNNKKFNKKINELNDSNFKLASEISDLGKLRSSLTSELQSLSTDNKTLHEHLKKMKSIQINSRKLINSLLAAGDDYKEFNKIFENNVHQLQDTEQMLNILVNDMRKNTFLDMDENNDGIVSQAEYNRYIKNIKTRRNTKR